ncbi:unnamed protein product, partial [Laminaria digitata]
QSFSRYVDGTVSTVAAGRNGTVKPSSKWVPSSRPSTIPPTVETYRPVPSSKIWPVVPSRRENLNIPSRPVVKNRIFRPVPSQKNIQTVRSRRPNKIFTVQPRRQNLPLPPRPAVNVIPVS